MPRTALEIELEIELETDGTPVMNVVVIGHGMVGHKLLECLLDDASAALHVTVLCEEPRPAYDRVHLSEFFSGKIRGRSVAGRSRFLRA